MLDQGPPLGQTESVRAVLRSLDSPDISTSLDDFAPSNPDDFDVFMQAEFGPENDHGGDVFGLTVCSPEALRRILDEPGKGFVFPRHRLVVQAWDIGVIRRAIEDLGYRCEGDTWRAVAEKLSRYMHWEFEDYRP